jgi:hypothetical protein
VSLNRAAWGVAPDTLIDPVTPVPEPNHANSIGVGQAFKRPLLVVQLLVKPTQLGQLPAIFLSARRSSQVRNSASSSKFMRGFLS